MNHSNTNILRAPIRLLAVAFLCCQNMLAQDATAFTVKGMLADSIDRQPLDAANVVVIRAKDSVYVAGNMSNAAGAFEIGKVPAGNYLLMVSFLGYETAFKPFSLGGTPRAVQMGTIGLRRQDLQIGEVVVAAKFNPIIVKKDTIEFNTSAYKVQESDVIEDLLKKLPGVEVEQDGSVTAGGQQVTKVFVDGKQFFGDDPKVALKNLPANIVDKVQVVDRKSDQAQFTGIEDDDTEKVLNLTLRPGNRDGTFGRLQAGYGSDERYDANGLISYFNGETQLAALMSSNNTNNLNFTDFMGDVMSSMGGGGRRIGRGMTGGGGGGRMLNAGGGGMSAGNGGLSTSTAGGANANYRLGEKLKIGANYFFNITDRVTEQESNRINFIADSTLNYDQWQRQNRKSQNHRLNLELDYTINERNSILIRPTLNIGNGHSAGLYDYITLTPSEMTINTGATESFSANTSFSTSGTALWRHKFLKAGRTLSVNLNYGWSDNRSDGENYQINSSSELGIELIDSVNQTVTNNNSGYNYSTRLSYVEPVGNDRYLEFSYLYSYSKTGSEKQTLDYNAATGRYDVLNTDYSTLYENTYTNQQADVRFNTRRDRYSYTIGAGLQPSSLTSITGSAGSEPLKQHVINFSPSANFTYGESRQNMLRFDYRGMTRQPTIQQLQPVADNTDPLYEFKGNLSLKPSFNHMLRAQYNNFNQETLRTFLTSLTFNTTRNSIVNSSAYDDAGKQTVMPENVNGAYNINASVMMNLPIAKTKLSFSNTLSGNYGNSISITNGTHNTTRNSNISETLRLTWRNDWLEAGAAYRLGYNRAVYTLQDKTATNYYNNRLSGELFITLPLGIIITSNIAYNFYRGYDDDYNRDMTLWNADVSKQVFKNQRGTIKLSIYDILKQNSSYTRTTTDNYMEDVHTNTIGQFAMISFLYRFNSFGGNNPPQSGQRNRPMNRSFGDGPPSGGGFGPPRGGR